MVTKSHKKSQEKQTELSAQQQQAVILLAGGKTVTETAAAVGVERETVSRWKNHDAQFTSALTYQQADLWDAAADKLRASILKAADALDELLEHEDESIRLRAIGLAYRALGSYPEKGRIEAQEPESINLTRSMRAWRDLEPL